MLKILFKTLLLVALFFSTWWLFYQVNWMDVLKVSETTTTLEEKFGDLMWDYFNKNDLEIKDNNIVDPINSLLKHICEQNNIDRNKISLHIINSEDINAFALPNNHIIIFSGLLRSAQNQGEVSGVISHELAHLELSHVMKKLVKEIGLSVIISATTGNNSSTVIIESLKHITSTAYDRSLEQAADIAAVDYLVNANINPEDFANFLFTLTSGNETFDKYSSWLSTHPYPKERAEYVIAYFKDASFKYQEVVSDSVWNELQVAIR